jgi:hypothetical protein
LQHERTIGSGPYVDRIDCWNLESGDSRFKVRVKKRKRASRDGGEMMICSDIAIQRKRRRRSFAWCMDSK